MRDSSGRWEARAPLGSAAGSGLSGRCQARARRRPLARACARLRRGRAGRPFCACIRWPAGRSYFHNTWHQGAWGLRPCTPDSNASHPRPRRSTPPRVCHAAQSLGLFATEEEAEADCQAAAQLPLQGRGAAPNLQPGAAAAAVVPIIAAPAAALPPPLPLLPDVSPPQPGAPPGAAAAANAAAFGGMLALMRALSMGGAARVRVFSALNATLADPDSAAHFLAVPYQFLRFLVAEGDADGARETLESIAAPPPAGS
jgi:hypothetical protein